MRVHTIGHSTRAAAEFLALLKAAGVARVADLRAYPASRRNPQFDGGALAAALAGEGIDYRHLPALGGRRNRQGFASPNGAWTNEGFRNFADYALTAAFRAGFSLLLALAKERPTALLCAEAVWWRCHRRIVADYLLAAGVEVVHILGMGQAEPARLSPGARVQADGSILYPPETMLLPIAAEAERRKAMP